MKILVTGAKGQLGSDIVEKLLKDGCEIVETDKSTLDISMEEEVKNYIKMTKADIVIHCAAFTSVDRAEEERELCYKTNVLGTRYIAEACADLDLKMLYISSDYVFSGKGKVPWKVSDIPEPVNYYGETKYLGELEVIKHLKKHYIIRTSWVFGKNGDNFVKKIIRLATKANPIMDGQINNINVVNDQIGSPTFTRDLAILISKIVRSEKYGTYHATNEGFCSWYEFACEIIKELKVELIVNPVSSTEYLTKAKRPHNSRLDKSSLKENQFDMLPSWKESIRTFINEN